MQLPIFGRKNENMRMKEPHLRPPKSPTEAKSRPIWSPENRGLTTTPRGQGKGSISRDNVDPMQWI